VLLGLGGGSTDKLGVNQGANFRPRIMAVLLAAGVMSLMTIGEVRAIESLAFEPSDSPHAVKRCVFHRLSGQLKESFAQLLNRLNSLIVGRSDLPDDAKMKFAQRALLIGEMEKRTVLQFEPMNHGLFKALDELSTRDAALRLRSVIERAPDQRIVPYELVDRAVRQNQISPLSGQMYINSRYLEDWLRVQNSRNTLTFPRRANVLYA
jgi:hypothetical protein